MFDPAAEIDHIQIGLIRALAGIHRLRIVHLLGRGPMEVNHGLAWDAMADGASRPVKGTAAIPWLETFRMAKELGTVSVLACSGSLDVLGIDATALDPIVDSSGGIAVFLLAAEDGQLVFI